MRLSLMPVLFLFVAASCTKTNSKPFNKGNANLLGKWKYVEQYVSTGGPGTWRPATPAGRVIEFKNGGRFVPSDNFLNDARTYEFIDSAIIRLSPAANDSGYVNMGYILSNNDKQLELFPVAPYICIEGCSSKFVRE